MNCKPGDLAIVTCGWDEDLGVIVEVIRLCPPCEWENVAEPEWECKTRRPVRVKLGDKLALSCEFDVKDSWLRPISGVPVTDDVDMVVPA
ncbi:hypothetical protein [Burkholderia pseudomallei]